MVLLILILICVGVVLIVIINQLKNYKDKLTQNEKEIETLQDLTTKQNIKIKALGEDNSNLSVARKLLELEANLTAEEKSKLEVKNGQLLDKIDLLQEELFQLQSSIQVEAVKNDSVEDLEVQLANLRRIIDDKVGELERLDSTAREVTELMNQKVAATAELEAGMRALEGRILSGREVLEEINRSLVENRTDLANLMQLKASVLAVEEGAGSVWTFEAKDKKRLVELIHQLVDEYGTQFPVLRRELLKAEWSSVWLPQVQQLCSREGLDRSGIYKITDKANPNTIYIGQAQSIKERWYTHIKKMLGVEAKGSERLYEYGPDEVTWEVVEFKDGNLDADEKYWIDYFKCREIGLNKKG